MSETVLVLAGSGERIRVNDPYGLLTTWKDQGWTVQVQTRGTFPGDPRVTVDLNHVALLIPAESSS